MGKENWSCGLLGPGGGGRPDLCAWIIAKVGLSRNTPRPAWAPLSSHVLFTHPKPSLEGRVPSESLRAAPYPPGFFCQL